MYIRRKGIDNNSIIEDIALYYDKPEKEYGYTIYNEREGIYLYSEVSEYEDIGDNMYSSNLIMKMNDKNYKVLREEVQVQALFNYTYRYDKINNELEYSEDNINYSNIGLLTEKMSQESMEEATVDNLKDWLSKDEIKDYAPVTIVMDDEIELDETLEYRSIYRKYEDSEDYVYYDISNIKLSNDYDLYVKYTKIGSKLYIYIMDTEGMDNNLNTLLQILLFMEY